MKSLAVLLFALIWLTRCTSEGGNPIAKLQQQYAASSDYAIILNDMKEEGNFSTDYYHRYKIIYTQNVPGKNENLPEDRETDWLPVSEPIYDQYKDSLGLVIASKSPDGKVSSSAYPPGYQYVDNPRYGHWTTDNSGNSFWEFYGKYAMFSHVMGMAGNLIYRNDYDRYRDYRQQNKPYYGNDNRYGTNGYETKKRNQSFFQRKQAREDQKNTSFKSKFRSRMGGYDGKAGRSQSSGSRSRSRGFGK